MLPERGRGRRNGGRHRGAAGAGGLAGSSVAVEVSIGETSFMNCGPMPPQHMR